MYQCFSLGTIKQDAANLSKEFNHGMNSFLVNFLETVLVLYQVYKYTLY